MARDGRGRKQRHHQQLHRHDKNHHRRHHHFDFDQDLLLQSHQINEQHRCLPGGDL